MMQRRTIVKEAAVILTQANSPAEKYPEACNQSAVISHRGYLHRRERRLHPTGSAVIWRGQLLLDHHGPSVIQLQLCGEGLCHQCLLDSAFSDFKEQPARESFILNLKMA
ncbi:uncharacterized protein LOC124159153 isoform X1 [Ischnura elegans]|uniref:uncharacterized protein LOC124159153 isoform X1 n=1 Tax=Ischnura elegans TaxID=197161 RepID=UPI001ED872AD|nr:uncharacterized protein LOC124159153 isoform X1 [Ischnura elegans]